MASHTNQSNSQADGAAELERARDALQAYGVSVDNMLTRDNWEASSTPSGNGAASDPVSSVENASSRAGHNGAAATSILRRGNMSTYSSVRRASSGMPDRSSSKASTLAAVAQYFEKAKQGPAPAAAAPSGGDRAGGGRGADAADLLFEALDGDGDGEITRAEMHTGFRSGAASAVGGGGGGGGGGDGGVGAGAGGGVVNAEASKRSDIVMRQARLKELRERRKASEARLRSQG
eukprot:SAG11_NODE_291_length_11180_cov_102.040155_6_plen_234_part_00